MTRRDPASALVLAQREHTCTGRAFDVVKASHLGFPVVPADPASKRLAQGRGQRQERCGRTWNHGQLRDDRAHASAMPSTSDRRAQHAAGPLSCERCQVTRMILAGTYERWCRRPRSREPLARGEFNSNRVGASRTESRADGVHVPLLQGLGRQVAPLDRPSGRLSAPPHTGVQEGRPGALVAEVLGQAVAGR